jgi:ElaB/YqjD/DUF883 family membrane-anchored ribosome-binding protein
LQEAGPFGASTHEIPSLDEAQREQEAESERLAPAAVKVDHKTGPAAENKEEETQVGITGMLQNAGDTLRKGTDDVLTSAKETMATAGVFMHEPLSQKVKNTAGDMDHKLGEAAEQTGKQLQETKEYVSDAVKHGEEGLSSGTHSFIDAVRSALFHGEEDPYPHDKAARSEKAAHVADKLDHDVGAIKAVDHAAGEKWHHESVARTGISGVLHQAQENLVKGAESVVDAVRHTLGATSDGDNRGDPTKKAARDEEIKREAWEHAISDLSA